MFRKFLKSKLKRSTEKEKVEKAVKKVKEEKPKEVQVKEKVKIQPVINKLLTAEGWLRRQKKS
jgi:ribosomal protein L31E